MGESSTKTEKLYNDLEIAKGKAAFDEERGRTGSTMENDMKRLLGTVAVLALAAQSTAALAAECTNDVWNKVMESGKITIGVKADYKPWGFRDESGELVGMEIDMANEVAAAMGIEAELVPVQSSNRMQFLEQGKVDMFIATMSDRADRREIVGIPGPNYYTSGTNIMSPKALGFKEWEDLRDKPVCGKQGAFYNQIVEERYGVEIVAFTGNAEAKQALRDKKCVAWVYDDSSIGSDLASGNWEEFEMPLASEDDNPWGLAVPLAEQSCVFGNFMSGMQYNWHRSGKLIELEEKWGIQPTAYLKDQAEKFSDWIE
ncbi:MAG: transporter substrate-binding domain-containing protein [Pseudomonadota bacterium]